MGFETMRFGPDNTLFDYLRGRWSIARAIDDRAAGLTGAFEGVATFLPTAETGVLDYAETGRLAFGPFAHTAERRYRWRCRTPDRASVLFEDGRFFHRVQPSGGIATARHLCGRDLYRGRYRFETPERWQLQWHVTGPRKDYTMDSVFTRGE